MGSNTKAGSAAKIRMESFDDLFGGNAAQENGAEQIISVPLTDLYTFKDHPFRVADDEGNSFRPTSFDITYYIDGEYTMLRIYND